MAVMRNVSGSGRSRDRTVMWDSSLYAVNMFYHHWLIKKLLWPVAGQNIDRWKNETE